MKTPSSLLAVRVFRPERTPRPRFGNTGENLDAAAFRIFTAREAGLAVDLEIGCGVGWHPIEYAGTNPDRLLFAIEHTAEKFAKFRERLRRNSPLPNLFPVHADAVAWLAHLHPNARFDRVLILYPNPNPKNKSARWVRMPFFGYLRDRLAPGGTISFRTNSAAYHDEVRDHAVFQWAMRVSRDRAIRGSFGERPITHFERKYLERGETCWEIELSPERDATLPT